MSLADKISVKAVYTRSVNLERDIDSPDVIGRYIPTARAIQTLERMATTLTPEAIPRAWSLIGPYGAGKSSFAAFLTYLLAGPHTRQAAIALQVLERAQPGVTDQYRTLQGKSDGHCIVVLTGSPQPLGRRLAQALAEAAARCWSNRAGRRPEVIATLRDLADQEPVLTGDLLTAVTSLQDALSRNNFNGLLIVIDELGKFLEYEARHYGANDIFLLQALAERACTAHPAKLSLVVLLHQAMDQYARGLSETLRNEWAKVQGRFETIPLVETAEQVLRVVATAFSHDFSDDEFGAVRSKSAKIAAQLAEVEALPKTLDQDTAAELFARCYPLHPLGALLLPTLCQKMAQNERTLFSYLGSREPHGLSDSLQRLSNLDDWVLPWEIFEYFIRNQSAVVTDHPTRRRWMEVVTAVERLGDAPEPEVRLLKSIGLLNIIGPQGGLKASREIVALCADTPERATTITQGLIAKSLLQYRKFSGEYRVWEGSDFDLDRALDEQIERLGRFNLAEALNNRHALEPIVVRRHTIRTGTLRYFVQMFADSASFHRLPKQGKEPRIVFFLVHSQADRMRLADEGLRYFGETDIVVEWPDADRLRQVVAEVMALEVIQREAQALNTDPVAQREFKDRYAAALTNEQDVLRAIAENPGAASWYWKGKGLPVSTKRGLQSTLSEVLDQLYHASPIIKNELINRNRLSSSAALGRNRLFAAMLEHVHEEDLGLTGFPAEKGIYRALLRSSGLHRPDESGHWRFAGPPPADPLCFGPVWKALDQRLDATSAALCPVPELWQALQAPPLGLRLGPLPLLLAAYLLAHPREVALYEEDFLIPRLRYEHLELLATRPERFAVERQVLQGGRLAVFGEYLSALVDPVPPEPTLLDIVRQLAKLLARLPEYTRHTRLLSPSAMAVRNALIVARRPATLLFETLPKACECPPFMLEKTAVEATQQYLSRLGEALRELLGAYPILLSEIEGRLRSALQLNAVPPGLPALRVALHDRFSGLVAHAGPQARDLLAFLNRLTQDQDDDIAWLESVATLLGRIPPAQWRDSHPAEAFGRLIELAGRVNDLIRLQVAMGAKSTETSGRTVLMRILSGDQGEGRARVVHIADPQALDVLVERLRPTLDQLAGNDKETRLALLARCLEELTAASIEQGSETEEMTDG